jgi:RES domain
VSGRQLWRVGHRGDPLGFTPHDLCQWSQRFDDAKRRFRTVYCAERPATSLREVLADFRPNLAAIEVFLATFGREASAEVSAEPVTARWREEHVLAPAEAELDGPLVDLTDVEVRGELEERHRGLLVEHGLEHLDLHEITTRRRALTQAIATDLYNRLRAGAVRFPSRLDGSPCLAVFEGQGELVAAGSPIELTDPAPDVLLEVCGAWGLKLERT